MCECMFWAHCLSLTFHLWSYPRLHYCYLHSINHFSTLWQGVVDHATDECASPIDLIRIHISHRDLRFGDIKIPVRRISDVTPDAISERISDIAQSHRQLFIEDIEEMFTQLRR